MGGRKNSSYTAQVCLDTNSAPMTWPICSEMLLGSLVRTREEAGFLWSACTCLEISSQTLKTIKQTELDTDLERLTQLRLHVYKYEINSGNEKALFFLIIVKTKANDKK